MLVPTSASPTRKIRSFPARVCAHGAVLHPADFIATTMVTNRKGERDAIAFDVGRAQFEKFGVLRLRESLGYALLARTATDPGGLERAVRAAFLAVDSTQPVFQVQPLEKYGAARSLSGRQRRQIPPADDARLKLVAARPLPVRLQTDPTSVTILPQGVDLTRPIDAALA
jgi:hypothetical protein